MAATKTPAKTAAKKAPTGLQAAPVVETAAPVMVVLTDAQVEQLARKEVKSFKKIIEAQPTKTITLPLDPFNPKKKIEVFTINGYKKKVKIGVPQEVPISIYENYLMSQKAIMDYNKEIPEQF